MLIPYIFKGGTRAKALEVNQNFIEVQKSIEENEKNIAANTFALDNKANIKGDSSIVFSVAESNTPTGAVNLQQINQMMSPFMQAINGFMFDFTDNPLEIQISQGTCFDTNYKYIISTTGTTTLDLSSSAKDIANYIYVVKDITTNTPPIIETSSNIYSPVLPTETTVFRKIGQVVISGNTIETLQLVGTRINYDEVQNVK